MTRQLRSSKTFTFALAMLLVTPTAWAQGVGGGISTVPQSTLGNFAQSLQQARVTACAPVLQQASQFLFDNAPSSFVIQPLGPDPNRWPTAVSIETDHPSGQVRFTTLIIAPAGSCSGLYQQVVYWAQPCTTVKKTVFGAFGAEHYFLKSIRVSEVNAGLQLYLMQAGGGCISIKKELLH